MQEENRQEIAMQLARMNEQLEIKNCHSKKIWKILGLALGIIIGLIFL